MYLGTLESDFARGTAIVISFGVIFFALQGIVLPEASFYGQILFWGIDMLQLMQWTGLGAGVIALASIYIKNRTLQRVSFAFIAWFYMTFVFVLVWLVGLQAPSVVFALMTVLMSGAVYGYLTQKGKRDENINRGAYSKDKLRKSISSNNSSTGHDKR